MTYRISKTFELSYSHQLYGLPDGHQCARVHGHNAIVAVELEAEKLDKTGFVVDYGQLAPMKKYLDDTFDHRHLNDVLDFNPTAERLAQHLFTIAKSYGWPVSRIGWSETPKTWAYYSEGTPS